MKRSILWVLATAALLFSPLSLVSFAGPAAAQQICWQNGVSHTCRAGETTALNNAGPVAAARALIGAEPRVMLGQTVSVSAMPACVAAIEGAHLNVFNATAPTWHTALTTTVGAIHVGAVCRGGSWLAE